MATDASIVKAAVYPAIGIARVGNSPDEYFIGPEIPWPASQPAGFYKDARGALKRQAARFRVYGLDGGGKVVRELTSDDAQITWKVQVANRKAAWYEFDVALDIPEAKPVRLRNANIADRSDLIISPDAMTISGKAQSGTKYRFDKGRFLGEPVYLGELRTDDAGRLLFLGGHGVSRSPFGKNPPTTFANNEGWYDDISDGPVEAEVVYGGRRLDVEGAWVASAPPNYAPDLISVQTLWDVIFDSLSGLYVAPRPQPSFMADILPLLNQFSMTQWVNKGFFDSYGYGQPYDFSNQNLLYKLATVARDTSGRVNDQFQENRRQIFNYFRPPTTQEVDPRMWPWLYGDNMNVPATTANGYFTVTGTIYKYLQQWAAGDFVQDWDPQFKPPASLDEITDPAVQAEMLTKSALWFCLGGPFHPGCELTWPMRLPGMYTGPFRIRRRAALDPEPDLGPVLSPADFQNQFYFTSPLSIFWNGPGTLTRWMAVPWQTDTASCRAGYEAAYDPYIPTFWPTHVPNHVLAKKDYDVVIDTKKPRDQRLAAFNRRVVWFRILGANYLDQIENMVQHFGDLGVVEQRPGIKDDPAIPAEMYVESTPGSSAGAPVTGTIAAHTALASKGEEAKNVDEIPGDRGLIVGPVGRGAATEISRVCVDVAVIGGGPSGALTARNIARAGRRVILIDAALRQATRIGEALVPSARVILEEIELFDAFMADGHLPSFGNESSWGSTDVRRTDFIRSPHGHGWQVDRTRFDALLLSSAREAGVLVLENSRLRTFRADFDGTWILSASGPGGLTSRQARWLVDATGRSGFVCRHLGVRRFSEDRLLAFSSLFRPADGADLDSLSFVESVEDGWWYTALLSSGVRTVTFFTDAGLPAAKAARTREGFLSLLFMTVHLSKRLEAFHYEIADGPQATDARTSRLERFYGSGWIAVGDAAMSLDPLSSQGLLTALYGALKAAAALIENLESQGNSLERYEAALLLVYDSFRTNRLEAYGFERRWTHSPFWKSRHR